MDATPSRTGAYWAALPAEEHLVQFYDEDFQLLDTLEGFVAAGLRMGHGVVVIASAGHLHQLEQRLRAMWLDPDRAKYQHRYHPVLDSECLAKFAAGGEIDEARFNALMEELIAAASGDGRPVRIFGEMAALLWKAGHRDGALRLEKAWHDLCARANLQALCAYPRRLFELRPGEVRAVREHYTSVLES